MSARQCGSCTLCCKVMGIYDLQKPSGTWCPHAKPGAGCGIYADRPAACREFECLWLQRDEKGIPEEFKPERVHAVLSTDSTGDKMIIHLDPGYPTAHREGAFGKWVESLTKKMRVIVICRNMVVTKMGNQWVRCTTVQHNDKLGTFDAYLPEEAQ